MLILLLICFSLCILGIWQRQLIISLGQGSGYQSLSERDRQAQSTPGTGHYTVSGLGTQKQAILSNGGTVLDLAIAMLETETMQANYTYGDGKTDDSGNFGIFKQNWFMLRTSCSQFQDQTASQYNNGAILNNNLSADISCIHQSQSHYGIDKWFGGQRNGETGVNTPNTADINTYKNAVYWIRDQLLANTQYLKDDTRFFVVVKAI
jgi:Glycosyl hydrolase family 134